MAMGYDDSVKWRPSSNRLMVASFLLGLRKVKLLYVYELLCYHTTERGYFLRRREIGELENRGWLGDPPSLSWSGCK